MAAPSHRFSHLGIGLCAVYLLLALVAVAFGAMATGDPKGSFVLLQLPIAIQGATLSSLGLGPLLQRLSWLGAYAVLGLPTFVLLYFLGALIEYPFRRRL